MSGRSERSEPRTASHQAPSMLDTHRAINAVWRIESGRVIAGLTRIVRDVGLAEDLAQDALVAALEQWPAEGVPNNPGAWLMATARHRAVDVIRQNERRARRHEQLARELELQPLQTEPIDEAGVIEDDLLNLIFMCCHPVVPAPARVALVLRVLGGLTTEEIARAFLVATPTVAQRIVRAKRILTDERVAFERPGRDELAGRLATVLEVVYLIFNEGYSATAGPEWTRPQLCEEALRLGRVLAELVPGEPEAHGLVALMELQASRIRARRGPDGEPIRLLDQDRARWDRLLIGRGLAALARSEALGAPPGPYRLQAAIAACHAQARTPEATDWARIAALYHGLVELMPTPVVALNRAVAVGMAYGPEVGLHLVDQLADEPSLRDYHLLPSVRGDLLERLGRAEEARTEFARAATMTRNEREKALLLARAAELSA